MGQDSATGACLLADPARPASVAGRSLSRQTLKVGAQYANRVRWDLRGGCSEMGIPTAMPICGTTS